MSRRTRDRGSRAVLLSLTLTSLLAGWLIRTGTGLSHVTTTNTVQFDREIVGILDAHCVACHAPDDLATPLVTYEETWLDRASVLRVVMAGHMPPWGAVPGYGKFANDNSLTLREKQFLVSWVEGLGPRNDGSVFLNVLGAETPPPVTADVEFPEWVFGEPDIRVAVPPPEGLESSPTGPEDFLGRALIDPDLSSEAWVRGLEYRPAEPGMVRAAVFRLESSGQWLGAWTPWHGFVELPEGLAYRISAGDRIAAEMHFTSRGPGPAPPAGTLGLVLAEEQPAPVAPSDLVLEASGAPPSGGESVRLHAESVIAADTRVLSLFPEFGPGIESIEVSVRRPDGGTDILLFARDIPVRWPTPYVLTEPFPLAAGSRVRVTAYYSSATRVSEPAGIRLTVSRY